MSEEDIIKEFICSDNFIIINDYITKPYEETIKELDKEIERLIKELKFHKRNDIILIDCQNDVTEKLEELKTQLQQKENIIKEAREKVNTIQFEVRSNDKKYSNLYITLKSILQGQELLEILDKVSDE